MSVYYLSYEDLSNFYDKCITKENCKSYYDNYVKHKAEILSALTCDSNANGKIQADTVTAFWQEGLQGRSKFLFGTKYISVKSVMLNLLEAFCCSGFLDEIINSCVNNCGLTLGLSIPINIFMGVKRVFESIQPLEDWDFCIYLQAVHHFKAHRQFTIEDLSSWFPNGNDKKCNMHTDKWDCSYFCAEQDSCTIISEDNILQAVKSLCSKGILVEKIVERKLVYQLVY